MNNCYPCNMPFEQVYLVVTNENIDFRFCPYHERNDIKFDSYTPLELDDFFNKNPGILKRRTAFLNHDYETAGCKEGCAALSKFRMTGEQYCFDDFKSDNRFKVKKLWLSMWPDCNIRCRYCFDSVPNDQITLNNNTWTSKILTMAGDFVLTGGNLLLTGGEPFLPKWGLNNVLQKLAEKQNSETGTIDLQTNGTFLNKKTRELIMAAPVSYVGISFDTCRPYLFNYLRRGSSYHKILDNTFALRDEILAEKNSKIKIIILCAVLKITAPYIKETVEYFIGEGFQVNLNYLHESFYASSFSIEQGLHNLSDIALEQLYNDILYLEEKYNDSGRIAIRGFKGQLELIRSYRKENIDYQISLVKRNDFPNKNDLVIDSDEIIEKKKDVKIFVSHRIKLTDDTLDNPFFHPIRCGAVYDQRKDKQNIPGDDTEENISEKKNSFCELTVLYWAWKNISADYYGFCQYQSYFSFSEQIFETNNEGYIVEPFLDKYVIDKYEINTGTITSIVKQYDIIVGKPIDIRTAFGHNSVKENWDSQSDLYNSNDMEETKKIIGVMYPDYLEDYDCYMNSKNFYFNNYFIMEKSFFHDYCKWLFSILFELEKRIDTRFYSKDKSRVFSEIGKRLHGVFLFHLKRTRNIKVMERQTIFLEETDKQTIPTPYQEANNLPILLISSNEYVPILGTFISSVLDHASTGYGYDFIVLHKKISESNQLLLGSFLEKYRKKGITANIRFYTVRKRELINYKITEARFIEILLYRLYAPWILDNKYKKALVIDIDIIVRTDIANLFKEDISDYWAAGVIDIVYQGMLNKNKNNLYGYTKDFLGIREPYNYVNAGMKLLNLEKIRNELSEEDFHVLMQGNKYRIDEQDVFNSIFSEKIKFINLKWNYSIGVNWFLQDKIINAPLSTKELYDSCTDPAIVHWTIEPKPWHNPGVPFGFEFWKVARDTPFYELLLDKRVSEQNTSNSILAGKNNIKKSFKMTIKSAIKRKISFFFPAKSIQGKLLRKIYNKIRIH